MAGAWPHHRAHGSGSKPSTDVMTRWRDTSVFHPGGRVWRLGKNWPQFAVLIQMFGRMSALPTMPPRRLETWNFAWREGGAEEAGQASEVWFSGRLGAAVPFPLGRACEWFRGAAK